MKLRRRQKRKADQALDAVASVTKVWSDWQVGKRASKGVAKAKELRPPSKRKGALRSKWVKVGGALAVAGAAAGAVVAKLKRRGEPEVYSGPAPSDAVDATPDVAPLSAAPDPATQERDTDPAVGSSALRESPDADAAEPAEEPAVTEDAATETASDLAPEQTEAADDAPADDGAKTGA